MAAHRPIRAPYVYQPLFLNLSQFKRVNYSDTWRHPFRPRQMSIKKHAECVNAHAAVLCGGLSSDKDFPNVARETSFKLVHSSNHLLPSPFSYYSVSIAPATTEQHLPHASDPPYIPIRLNLIQTVFGHSCSAFRPVPHDGSSCIDRIACFFRSITIGTQIRNRKLVVISMGVQFMRTPCSRGRGKQIEVTLPTSSIPVPAPVVVVVQSPNVVYGAVGDRSRWVIALVESLHQICCHQFTIPIRRSYHNKHFLLGSEPTKQHYRGFRLRTPIARCCTTRVEGVCTVTTCDPIDASSHLTPFKKRSSLYTAHGGEINQG